jgi:hypothetical protein
MFEPMEKMTFHMLAKARAHDFRSKIAAYQKRNHVRSGVKRGLKFFNASYGFL